MHLLKSLRRLHFTTDLMCALTGIQFIQVCNKVTLATFTSLCLCFLRTSELSEVIGRAKNVAERKIQNHTEKYLQKLTFRFLPENICTRCAFICLHLGLETPPCDSSDQSELSNSDQILKTCQESLEQTVQKYGGYVINSDGLIKSKDQAKSVDRCLVSSGAPGQYHHEWIKKK